MNSLGQGNIKNKDFEMETRLDKIGKFKESWMPIHAAFKTSHGESSRE